MGSCHRNIKTKHPVNQPGHEDLEKMMCYNYKIHMTFLLHSFERLGKGHTSLLQLITPIMLHLIVHTTTVPSP